MPKSNDIVTIENMRMRMETERALCFANEAGDEVWLPKSQCEYDHDNEELQLPYWLAKEKELVE